MSSTFLAARLILAVGCSLGLAKIAFPVPSPCDMQVKDGPNALLYHCVPGSSDSCQNCEVTGLCKPVSYQIGHLIISECWCTSATSKSQDACSTTVEFNDVTGSIDVLCQQVCCDNDCPPYPGGPWPVYTDPCPCPP